MKWFGNVFLLMETEPGMIGESMCSWRVLLNGATPLLHRRRGKQVFGCFNGGVHNSDSMIWSYDWLGLTDRFLSPCRFTQYQRMHGTLAQCEFSMLKTLMVYDMNIREMENYEKIYSNIGMQVNQPLLTLWQCNVVWKINVLPIFIM